MTTKVEIFDHNIVRTLEDSIICAGFSGYISRSFDSPYWANYICYSTGAYQKPFHHDETGLIS